MRSSCFFVFVLLLGVLPLQGQYQRALPGYHYRFPRDNFNHPEYQTEWWYYTGNLKASDGHRFGFELTFFRQALSQDKATQSDWDIHDIYLAHFALSDLEAGKFYYEERVNRAGPGIAGSSEHAEKIWNGNWSVSWSGEQQNLFALSNDVSINFKMNSQKPPVIHGQNGISQKAAGAGHASHYISYTRLLTNGTIQLNGRNYSVDGSTWMDHEFFTNSLSTDQTGWDWISLQLNDNTEIMLYRFRRKDGTIDPFSSGTYIDAQGRSTNLTINDFSMIPKDKTWTSPATHAAYPIEWLISIPELAIKLSLKTALPSQELISKNSVGPSYWEGSITGSGTRNSSPVRGVGYLEMTGYTQPVRFAP